MAFKLHLALDARAWYTWYMTNNMTRREYRLAEQGYSTREIEEEREHATTGSYYANALAFIIEAMHDEHTLSDIETLDPDTAMEFCDLYNTTLEMITKAIGDLREVADMIVGEELD